MKKAYNCFDRQADSGKKLQKSANKTWIKILALGLTLIFVSVGFFGYINLKQMVVHSISLEPYGLNVSIYEEENSRGFSWWTEYQGKKNEETLLFISTSVFNAEEVYESKSYHNIVDGAYIDGTIAVISGTSKIIKGDTRIDKLFNVQYVSHTVSVNNLQENQKYYYAVGGNGCFFSDSFKTDSDNMTTICNFNDFQTSDGSKLFYGSRTISAINYLNYSEIDFFAFGGDFSSVFSVGINRYNKYLGWMKSRESLSDIISSVPMVMAKGNHDDIPYLFENNQYSAYESDGIEDHYFSFNYNNIHFIILDSNNFSIEQKNWLKNDLQQAENGSTIWKIIMIHEGPYTTGDHGFVCDEQYIKEFCNICSNYKVDLVLQAHDHTYSKTYPYYWNTKGYYSEIEEAKNVVNFYPNEIDDGGIIYDYIPNGTYYISCGASGHRIGENKEYAKSDGLKSYINRKLKIAISKIKIDSPYSVLGENSSVDLGMTMFGLLNINDNKLIYNTYAVGDNGIPILYDQLAIMK